MARAGGSPPPPHPKHHKALDLTEEAEPGACGVSVDFRTFFAGAMNFSWEPTTVKSHKDCWTIMEKELSFFQHWGKL